MKILKRYLCYRLESSALRTVVFTVISAILTWNTVSDCTDGGAVEYNETGIYILAVVLGALCTVIPILELSAFKNRRNLDTLYFFPINRGKMALVHYISGFIQVLFAYTVTFGVAYVYLAANTDYFALGYMPLYYLLSVLLGLVMYSFFTFVFWQANTVADGVVFCVLWMFVIYIVAQPLRAEVLRTFLAGTKYWENSANLSEWGIVYAPINNLTVIFQDLIEINKDGLEYYYRDEYAVRYLSQAYMFFAWGVVGIAAALGYLVTFIKKGAEKAGEISSSIFGYKLLIPLYGYSLLMMYDSIDFMTVLIFIAMVIGYIIYRRSFRLKTSDLVFTGCGALAVVLGMMF